MRGKKAKKAGRGKTGRVEKEKKKKVTPGRAGSKRDHGRPMRGKKSGGEKKGYGFKRVKGVRRPQEDSDLREECSRKAMPRARRK